MCYLGLYIIFIPRVKLRHIKVINFEDVSLAKVIRKILKHFPQRFIITQYSTILFSDTYILTCNKAHGGPENDFCQHRPLEGAELLDDAGPHYRDRDVKLQGVREQDAERDGNLDALR